MYGTSTMVFFITSREIEMFHCQLSGGRKPVLTRLKAVLDPTPATAAFKPGLIVSRLRQVGQSAKLTRPPCQPLSTDTDQGGLLAMRRMSSITIRPGLYQSIVAGTA